jgi:hypothetical protein
MDEKNENGGARDELAEECWNHEMAGRKMEHP